jgi:hypothetical protein
LDRSQKIECQCDQIETSVVSQSSVELRYFSNESQHLRNIVSRNQKLQLQNNLTMGFWKGKQMAVAVSALLMLSLSTCRVCAFTMPPNAVAPHVNDRSIVTSKQGVLVRSVPSELFYEKGKKKECRPCEEPLDDNDDDIDLSKREAAFAMLGSIWAVGMLPTVLVFPNAANAAYGADAKILLPNPVEGLIDRQEKRCLVESLGNRECLVYEDPTGKLYQGLDNQVLLERIQKISVFMATIPGLIESKKWSQVTGVLTGPMGELIRTMGQLADLSENAGAAKDSIKQIKLDLYGISAAVAKKDVDKAKQYHTASTCDLVAFIKLL